MLRLRRRKLYRKFIKSTLEITWCRRMGSYIRMNLAVNMASSPTRLAVLSLYRRILRLSQTWESKDASNSAQDREYIRQEAKTLFRRNKDLTDPQQISSYIQEAEARVEIALHYKNPYPRPVNVPPQALARRKGKEQGTAQEKLKKKARPIYIKSIDSPS